MRRDVREKALRAIVSSILMSDLTAQDIHAIGDAIGRTDDFIWEVGTILKEISFQLEKYALSSARPHPIYDDVTYSPLHSAMNIVKTKRLSKAKILRFISMIDPNDHLLSERKITTNELLADFFNRKPTDDASKLLQLLETGGIGVDEYLQGIMDKR